MANTTARLIQMGRDVMAPIDLNSGSATITLTDVYRVLPGKRITAKARITNAAPTLDNDARSAGDATPGPRDAEDETFIAKVFLDSQALARCTKESAGLKRLEQAGIPAPRVVASHAIEGGGEILVTEFLAQAETLANLLGRSICITAAQDHAISEHQVLAYLEPTIGLVGQLHRAGLIHGDLHFGNFLLQKNKAFILDGDAITDAKGPHATAHNLAAFFAQLPTRLDHLQPRLLSSYSPQYSTAKIIEAELKQQIHAIRQWRCIDILNKSVRDCSLFSVTQSFTQFMACARPDAAWLVPLLHDPDVFMNAHVVKRGNTCTVARASLNGRPLIIKRYNIKGVWHWLTRFWRPSRAWHSWVSAHRLQFWGIPTPRPVALIESRVGFMRRRAWFISEEAKGPNMAEHIGRFARGQVPDLEKDSLQELFKQLQEHQISHGDMKATNFIWANDHWVLIDLDSVQAHTSEAQFQKAWARDQARFKANWARDPRSDWPPPAAGQ
jgi:tRNA A-37 threonylcarbamoyl transferase component Bud32